MMENIQDIRAYYFMGNIDLDDCDLLIRLIRPFRYEDYFDELAEKRYQEQTKIDPLLDKVIEVTPEAELQKLLEGMEENGYFSYKSYMKDTIRHVYGIRPKVSVDEVYMEKPNPGLDLKIQKDQLRIELYRLSSDRDRESYVFQLLFELQNKYIFAGNAFKRKFDSPVLREVYTDYMSLLALAMHDIVILLAVGFRIGLSKQSILILQDLYKQYKDMDDEWFKDPHGLYPGLYNEMLFMRQSLCGETAEQFEASIPKRINTFKPIFDIERMKDLWRSLREDQFIDKGTLEEHFLFWFGSINDEPRDLRSINWIEKKNLLGYFVTQYCRAIQGPFTQRWKITQSVFTYNGQSVDVRSTNSMKSYMSRLEREERGPLSRSNEIDKLLKK
ncbi:hypothetical protein AAH029_06155 [Parabacteroides distasonis]|uniref:hypothetical protein n=1 Tax=Parabacteroides distasonis TaxID=823 RepID=UPI0039B5CF1E